MVRSRRVVAEILEFSNVSTIARGLQSVSPKIPSNDTPAELSR